MCITLHQLPVGWTCPRIDTLGPRTAAALLPPLQPSLVCVPRPQFSARTDEKQQFPDAFLPAATETASSDSQSSVCCCPNNHAVCCWHSPPVPSPSAPPEASDAGFSVPPVTWLRLTGASLLAPPRHIGCGCAKSNGLTVFS